MTTKSKPNKIRYALVLLIFIAVIATGTLFFSNRKTKNQNIQQPKTSQETEVKQEPKTPEPVVEKSKVGTTIKSGDSQFGSILFDGNNQAIYIWQLEESSTAECYGDCAVYWPPVLTDGLPVASGEVNPELLGTTKRNDGTIQVTYNSKPLYYYAHEKPGEVKCHNIVTHGGLWWVIKPNGIKA